MLNQRDSAKVLPLKQNKKKTEFIHENDKTRLNYCFFAPDSTGESLS